MSLNILLTGGSGFLGKMIKNNLEGNITTLGRAADNIISIDLSKQVPQLSPLDMVIHNAGKAHCLPKSKYEIKEFFDINVGGTKNLLEGLIRLKRLPKSIIYISSVSVYGLESGLNISEDAKCLGGSVYADSKIEAENVLLDWGKLNGVNVGILRLPLVAGPYPPGNLGAMIAAIKNGYYFNIRNNMARRSIVLGNDIPKIFPALSLQSGVYNLTDGYHPKIIELSYLIAKQLGKRKPYLINEKGARFCSVFGDLIGNKAPMNSYKLDKLLTSLTFDDSKARQNLNWNPMSVMSGFKIFD